MNRFCCVGIILAMSIGCGMSMADDRADTLAVLKKWNIKLDLDSQRHVLSVTTKDPTVNDETLKLLGRLQELDSLEINDAKITDAGVANLAGLTQLTKLYLENVPITDEAMKNLQNFQQLEVLSLRGTKITGSGLAHLAKLPGLLVLNLGKNAITNDALKLLKPFDGLETLVLDETKVTGEGLKFLLPLANLRVLNLNHCQNITDASLMNLVGLDNLRMLHVEGCKVTEKKVEKFKENMINIAVYYDDEQ